jgi:ADYC domain-containing protein
MRMQMRFGSFAALVVVTVAAPARADFGSNGTQMNGTQMNGTQMNGTQMNGTQMNGTQMNGVSLSGVSVRDLHLVGTAMHGDFLDSNSVCKHSPRTVGAPLPWWCSPCAKVVATKLPYCSQETWNATCVQAATAWCSVTQNQLVGGIFRGDAAGGGTVYLTLDAPPHPVNATNNADVLLYNFSYWEPYVGWQPVCGGANQAIPVAGHWGDCSQPGVPSSGCGGKISSDGFTLGCRDVGATAKCIEHFGYKPWSSVPESWGAATHSQTLETFHEACVRMVRGDYCGDGTPHTVDGTQIDVWDHMGVQSHPTLVPSSFRFEAGWTPKGAACISLTRYQSWGGSMTPPPPGQPGYPDAIAQCTQLSPVQWTPNGIIIIDGCGNFYDFNPNGKLPLPPGVNDWPRVWYDINNESIH